MARYLSLACVLLLLNSLCAQPFTRADSLLGYLYPERAAYDVEYYILDIHFDIENKKLAGTVTMIFRMESDAKRLQVDLAENMELLSVEKIGTIGSTYPVEFTREHSAVFLEFPDTLSEGSMYGIRMAYEGTPKEAENAPWDGGFVWSTDETGAPWVGVACEGEGASLWWPCKDHFTDEPDSVLMNFTVPDTLVAVGNGRLVDVSDGELPDTRRYTWVVQNPINLYNVNVSIGRYTHFSDAYISVVDGDTLDLDYYVLPENLDKAKEHFQQVGPMMDCFEHYFGKYPFYEDGFKLIETPYLGMEHQSAIAYGNNYQKGYQGLDLSGLGFDYIIIHESGHEWFGNSITAPDIADLWIHESFTTYSEAVYVECMSDYNRAMRYLNAQRFFIANKNPIIGPRDVRFHGWASDSDMYYKGSWMLQTIRKAVQNDSLWWAVIHGFATNYRHSIVSTDEAIAYFNKALGRDFTAVFHQYLYHPKVPVLEHRTTGKGKKVVLEYRWVADEPGFDLPVEVDIDGEKHWLQPTTTWQSIPAVGAKIVKPNIREMYFRTTNL